MTARVRFTQSKRVVGNSFYWYISNEIFKALDLDKYDELEVELIKKKVKDMEKVKSNDGR